MTQSRGFKQTIIDWLVNLIYKGISAVAIALALAYIGWYGYSQLPAHFLSSSATTVQVRNLITTELKAMSELTTAQISGKATVVVSQDRKLGQFSVGSTNLVYEGVGDLQAGINMNDLKAVVVDPEHLRIHILLPPPKITNIVLNIQHSGILANYKRWFGPAVELELQEKAQAEALAKIRTQACSGELLTATNANAQRVVERILATAGYKEITVETQSPDAGICSPPAMT
jgi:hypothetical protein